MKEAMKEAMKEDIKDFANVYGPMILFMCLLAGLEAIDGIAAIAAAMYIISIVFSAVIELVEVVKR